MRLHCTSGPKALASVGAEMAFLAGFCLPWEAKWRSGPHVDAAACHRMQTSPPAGMQSPFQLAGAHPDGMQMRPGCHPAGCKCIPMSIHANGCIFCIPRKAKHHATRTQPAAPGRNADVIPRIAGKDASCAASDDDLPYLGGRVSVPSSREESSTCHVRW
jgi:hypothetical protein